jgi:two-component system, cell cycle sensor histidine kinase and response regulator CckA
VAEAWRAALAGLERAPVAGLVALSLAGAMLAGFAAVQILGPGAGLGGAALAIAALVMALAGARGRQGEPRSGRDLAVLARDPVAWFATNAGGEITFRNPAADRLLGSDNRSLNDALGRATLTPAALLLRLQARAAAEGFARQDLAVPDGTLRLSVRQAGADCFLWRVEDFHAAAAPADLALRSERAPSDPVGTDLEEVPVALMYFGPDGILRSANRAARDLLWHGELRAALFHDIFEGLGRPVSDWLSDVVTGRLPGGAEVLRVRNAAEETFLQVTLRRFDDAGRQGALAVLNDATRLKTLEAQFAQSQKMQAIGQLAGGIAHDFNNLLTAIAGHCDLLLLRHGQEDPDFADLEQIRQNANRAAALVGQLLAFSRKQTLKPERLDLEDVLSDLMHLLNRLVVERVGLTLSHLGPGAGRPLRLVRADRRQLEQVLINLVVNARDAMPDGGSIVIETEPVTLVEPLLRDRASVPAGDYSVVRVIDHGQGIAPENLQKIFEPFFTTKRVGEGTGLGLSMVYGIVKQSGGYVFVDSTPGQGARFTLYFPAVDCDEPQRPAPPEPPRRTAVRQGDGVVLLVEDEAPVRAFAGRALRLRGYTVLEAASAEEALAVLEDPGLEVDVFVTDVVMPGLDGPSWVRKALETRPNVRVIFMSGYAEDSLSESQSRVPNSVFLPKPFSLNDLTETVQGQFA